VPRGVVRQESRKACSASSRRRSAAAKFWPSRHAAPGRLSVSKSFPNRHISKRHGALRWLFKSEPHKNQVVNVTIKSGTWL